MKISIITVSYNSIRSIEETFISVLEQTYRPIEYIVIDGQSVDGTVLMIEKYEKIFRDNGIDFRWISEKDSGISDAFNKGILMCHGELIGIINSDDKLYRDAIGKIADCYDKRSDVLYGNCMVFGENKPFEAIPHFKDNKKLLNIGMPIYHPATFISRNAYLKYGMYDTGLKYCMDRELLLRIYRGKGVFEYINFPLAWYREGGTNQANFLACADENMMISRRYGMGKLEALVRRRALIIKNKIWKLVNKR